MKTFLYYRTGKSALPCLLFHAGLNLPAFVLITPVGAEFYQRLLYGILMVVVVPLLPRPLFGKSEGAEG